MQAPLAPHGGAVTRSAGAANVAAAAQAASGDKPPLPSTIGRYRIIRLLGEGGMGAVYEAEQDQPRRSVALKVIKAAWASPELLRRFEQEAQALGRLHHPGIAQIYEAGSADAGFGVQPFFAMELIHGEPLAEYANQHKLNTRQRLELMIQVCDAVQHAHQRGIIHRDLKPCNILVDEAGQPKILDFGLARATDSDAQATRQTDIGQLLGTLAYMSPEQVLADPLALDTRSDVYALGVILYELLAGKLPYTLSRQLHEAVRTIQETDAAPLSTINRIYRGDIEIIVAKALEKDKNRRYGSAAALAGDIRRYLDDQPITAKPASASYQLQKFARRHKALVAGVAAVFAVLVLGVVASTWEAVQARRAERAAAAAERQATAQRDRALDAEKTTRQERDRAVAAEAQAQQQRNKALEEKRRADTETASATAVNNFLQKDLLGQASAFNQSSMGAKPDPDLKVRTALDRAAAKIQGKFDKQPEVEAAIRDTIGETYEGLGLYPETRKQLEPALALSRRALGDDNPKTLQLMADLAAVDEEQGKLPEAESLYASTLEKDRKVLGVRNEQTLRVMADLGGIYDDEGKYAKAEPLLVEALALDRQVPGPENEFTTLTMGNLAEVYLDESKYPQAEALDKQLIDIARRLHGAGSLDETEELVSLAWLYYREGKYADSEALNNQAIEVYRRVLGPEHPSTLNAMQNLATDYLDEGKYTQAEDLQKKVVESRKRVLGPENPETLVSMNNLALTYQAEGKYQQAEELGSKVLEVDRRVLGNDHPDTIDAIENLGVLYWRERKFEQAETIFKQTLEQRLRVQGPENARTLTNMNNLAVIYQHEEKLGQAEALLGQALQVERRVLGADHPQTLQSMNNLAVVYEREGRFADAEVLYTQTLATQQKALGPTHPSTLLTMSNLAEVYGREGKYAQAEEVYRRAVKASPDNPVILNLLAWSLVTAPDHRLRRADEALELARRIAKLAPDNSDVLNTVGLIEVRNGLWDEAIATMN
ncbi:MAG TPA: tetratricopeptide repeat protein [Terracidiphilus sp.]|nr:tetratricopeptide repeat protein [Terracidiphilus sp.]